MDVLGEVLGLLVLDFFFFSNEVLIRLLASFLDEAPNLSICFAFSFTG